MPAPTDSVAISAIPTAVVTAAGTDIFPVVQGGVTKRETLSQALTYIQTNIVIAESQVTNLVTDLAGKQPLDATLTALAAYNTNGLLTQTAADTFTGRTIAGTSNRISVGNGNGVAGNPTIDIDTAYVGQTSITTLGTIGTGVWQGTAVGAGFGGTGIASYAVGDLLYASGATALSKLADVATGNVLISGGVATAPSWGKVDLTAHVTGILPSANGGTGINNGTNTLTVPATGTAALLAVANNFTAAQSVTIDDAVTNNITTLLTLGHTSSGTPAAAFGTRMNWQLESTTTTGQDAVAIDATWSDAAHATRTARMEWWTATQATFTRAAALQRNILGRSNAVFISLGEGSGNALGDGSDCLIAGSSASAGFGLGRTNAQLLIGYLKSSGVYASNIEIGYITNQATQGTSSSYFIQLSRHTVLVNQLAASIALTVKGAASQSADLMEYQDSSANILGLISSIGAQLIRPRDAATNSVTNALTVGHASSGTPAAGYGAQTLLTLQSSTTADRSAGDITHSWVVATDASRTARVVHNVYDTAVREGFRIEASGSAPMIGFLGANAAARQTGGENVTNNVTAGGTTGQIDDITSLTVYSTDAAAIRNNIYQLARLVKQDHDALRLYGLLT